MARRGIQSSESISGDRRPSGSLGALRGILPYLYPYKLQIFGALISLSVAAGAVLVMGVGLRTLVDKGFSLGDDALLNEALLALFGIIAILTAATYARFFLVSWIGEKVVAEIRRDVFNHVLSLSPSFFEFTRTGEVMSRLTTDTTLLQSVVGSQVSVALRNLLLFLGGTSMLFITSPRLTAFVFLVVPLVITPIILFGRKVRKLSRASQDRVADLGAYIEETLNAVRTVQAFSHEKVDISRFGERIGVSLVAAVGRIRARAFLTATVMMLVFSSVGVILWLGGHDVLSNRISPGELSAFVFYAIVVAGSVGAISEVIGDLQRAAGASERLLELLSTEPDLSTPANPVPLPSPVLGRLVFDKVSFTYPSRPGFSAIEDFSLVIEPGETVALVGPSGAGKSTVIQLLMRFYDPQKGNIAIDNQDIKKVSLHSLRKNISLVSQDVILFDETIKNNISYAQSNANQEQIVEACKFAAAHEFIQKLPKGYETVIGENGIKLSGGQKQRISIARAILKRSPIILLDEATSSLDAESEEIVQNAIIRLTKNKTTLVIAHRLSTIHKADKIFVVKEGEIINSGDHKFLIENCKEYKSLYAKQLR